MRKQIVKIIKSWHSMPFNECNSLYIKRKHAFSEEFYEAKIIHFLLVWGFTPHSNHSYEDVTIATRAANLTYARHSRPFSSEGSLACHTYCDTGHPFMMVISEDL